MDYKIRALSAKDFTNDFFFQTLSNLKPVNNLTPALAEEILTDCQKRGIETYVAEIDGRVVGTIRLLFEPKFYHVGRLAAHIEDVATHPDYLGRGISSALIKYSLDICRQKGCYKVILDCPDNLVGFYKKFGFTEFQNCLRISM